MFVISAFLSLFSSHTPIVLPPLPARRLRLHSDLSAHIFLTSWTLFAPDAVIALIRKIVTRKTR